ncbi:hypothetical protein G6F31_015518 [Rhizopus arrhizus]|nr:hypothetical protein G6F31_015518 [Rhizopus arrhizus]
MLGAVESADDRARIAAYLDVFELAVLPALAALPSQIIHNDLSPSNILVDAAGSELAGILDFGDMVHAPRIAEIAIAASYQMAAAGNPLDVLSAVVAGYESVSALTPQERRHVLDLVLARLVQRMAIPSWRALRFPGNGAYILRSRAAATALFNELLVGAAQGAGARLPVVLRRTGGTGARRGRVAVRRLGASLSGRLQQRTRGRARQPRRGASAVASGIQAQHAYAVSPRRRG